MSSQPVGKFFGVPVYASNIKNAVGFGDWTDGWLLEETSGNPAPAFEPTEAEQLTCTQPARSPANILDEAIDKTEAHLDPDIELTVERNVACRMWDVSALCIHCGRRDITSSVTEWALEDSTSDAVAQSLVEHARYVMRTCIEGKCCDPLDRKVDGMTVRQCMEAWEWRQRYDACWPTSMTDRQIAAARLAWSSELKRKQAEAREKEGTAIVCDDDRWED